MRLYLTGTSRHNIGYTPDTLIIELKNVHYEYDITGTTDFNSGMLNTRTKGDLMKRDENIGDYVELTEQDRKQLISLLKNSDSDIRIAVYPISEDENNPNLDADYLTDCYGELCLNQEEPVTFKFKTEFYV